MDNKILDKGVEKLVVYDAKNKKELAIITHENVDTASPEILVKLKLEVKKDNEKGYEIKGLK